MSWYHGQWTHGRNSLAFWLDNYFTDYSFKTINEDKAEPTIVSFVNSPLILLDTRFYASSAQLYRTYKNWCKCQNNKPVSSWQFKHNMQLLGFPYLKSKRFYCGYYKYRVTTAFKNIGVKAP